MRQTSQHSHSVSSGVGIGRGSGGILHQTLITIWAVWLVILAERAPSKAHTFEESASAGEPGTKAGVLLRGCAFYGWRRSERVPKHHSLRTPREPASLSIRPDPTHPVEAP